MCSLRISMLRRSLTSPRWATRPPTLATSPSCKTTAPTLSPPTPVVEVGGDDSGIEVLVAETELTGTAPDASDCAASGFRSPTIDPGRTLTSADNDKMLIMELVRR